MGEPFLNFPRTVVGSTSTTYLNSASPQLLNLGSTMQQLNPVRLVDGCNQAFDAIGVQLVEQLLCRQVRFRDRWENPDSLNGVVSPFCFLRAIKECSQWCALEPVHLGGRWLLPTNRLLARARLLAIKAPRILRKSRASTCLLILGATSR